MLLIDEPYVSGFLKDTLREHNYPVISTPTAKRLLPEGGYHWITEAEASARLREAVAPRVYANSESALPWVTQHGAQHDLVHQVSVLKDKVAFRELIADLFPDFTFRVERMAGLQALTADELTFPFVIKPSVGFFSIGVHIVNDADDWARVQQELQPAKLRSIFPETVLDTSQFILEAFIPGEEYAIDYYHDDEGQVVVLNILHHVFSSGTDTSDRVYTTSKDIIVRHEKAVVDFLGAVGRKLNLTNFPAHAEVRIDEQGRIQPIEINPLRFGGWCTSADLLGVALGYNAYAHFMDNQKPVWDRIFAGKEEQLFSIVVLDNRSGLVPEDIAGFDYDKLKADFEHPLEVREFDVRQYGIFGFLFTETSPAHAGELQRILVSDLTGYIEPGSPGMNPTRFS